MRELREGSPDKLILIKECNMVKDNLTYYYGSNYLALGIPDNAKAKERYEFIKDVFENVMDKYKVVLCADAEMFKTLTGLKSTGKDGIACKSTLGATFIIPNWAAIVYNPAQEPRIKFILERVNEYLTTGISSILGSNVLKNVQYCFLKDMSTYQSAFTELSKHDALSAVSYTHLTLPTIYSV